MEAGETKGSVAGPRTIQARTRVPAVRLVGGLVLGWEDRRRWRALGVDSGAIRGGPRALEESPRTSLAFRPG